MIYLICQDWLNTSNNHAGMKYLSLQLEKRFPEVYKAFVIPDIYKGIKRGGLFRNVYNRLLTRIQHRKESRRIYKAIKPLLKKGDVVFLMEYLDKGLEMFSFAKLIKNNHEGVRLFCLVHLIPKKIDQTFPTDKILHSWIDPIDKLFTLGHSLTDYLLDRGIEENKLKTTFHYVDEFYMKNSNIHDNEPPVVLAMGNQVRNISLLKTIVDDNPSVNFTICQGLVDMTSIFRHNPNVKLIPFVPELELRDIMDKSDISLNVMDDTIGSNVIVTSLAMGLAMVCSDVGSIKDYCDDTNTLFCCNSDPDSFSTAIKKLGDSSLLQRMKKSSFNKARHFSIDLFHGEIQRTVSSLS